MLSVLPLPALPNDSWKFVIGVHTCLVNHFAVPSFSSFLPESNVLSELPLAALFNDFVKSLKPLSMSLIAWNRVLGLFLSLSFSFLSFSFSFLKYSEVTNPCCVTGSLRSSLFFFI